MRNVFGTATPGTRPSHVSNHPIVAASAAHLFEDTKFGRHGIKALLQLHRECLQQHRLGIHLRGTQCVHFDLSSCKGVNNR